MVGLGENKDEKWMRMSLVLEKITGNEMRVTNNMTHTGCKCFHQSFRSAPLFLQTSLSPFFRFHRQSRTVCLHDFLSFLLSRRVLLHFLQLLLLCFSFQTFNWATNRQHDSFDPFVTVNRMSVIHSIPLFQSSFTFRLSPNVPSEAVINVMSVYLNFFPVWPLITSRTQKEEDIVTHKKCICQDW